MSFALVPLAEATLFTLGCVAIHALRRQAELVTATLACLAVLLVMLVGIALAPETAATYRSVGIGDFAGRAIPTDPAVY